MTTPDTPDTPAHAAPRADLADWIRLVETPGLGLAGLHALLTRFGLPGEVLRAAPDALAALVAGDVARLLLAPPDPGLAALIARTLEWAAQPGNHVLTLADAAYPPQLLTIADPPAMLYVKGRIDLLGATQVAIVGSRRASPQGMAHARRFAADLSGAGLTITSGLALGIDAAAHQGALDGMGSTVAVIGTGADRVYPPGNHGLAQRIAADGAIVSEFPLGTQPLPHHFPRRNRLIAGLARGVLVVEAAARSGSLITARLAAEQGRDVFAIPGPISADLARGCHRLIREGAALVEAADDILTELGWSSAPARRTQANANATCHDDPVLTLLAAGPLAFDTLAQHSSMAAPQLAARLLELELAGSVARLAGDRYQRVE